MKIGLVHPGAMGAALGPVSPLALEELSELGERHRFLEAQVEDVRAARTPQSGTWWRTG